MQLVSTVGVPRNSDALAIGLTSKQQPRLHSVGGSKPQHPFLHQRFLRGEFVLSTDDSGIHWTCALAGLVVMGGLLYAQMVHSLEPPPLSSNVDDTVKAKSMKALEYVSYSPCVDTGKYQRKQSKKASKIQPDIVLPSGIWRGYSQQTGGEFEVVEFTLDFTPSGSNHPGHVTGSGTDDTGKYSLAGVYQQRRLAFQKKYIWGTPALDGQIKHESNTGHVVEYRAEWAGHNLRKGIKGIWFVDESGHSSESAGRFHIWPAMEGWQRVGQTTTSPTNECRDGHYVRRESTGSAMDYTSTDATEMVSTRSAKVNAFKVDQDHVCVKCYENPINVCLLPCGHTAICQACEGRLRHRLCPICYAPVSMIATENGTVMKSKHNGVQQASEPV